MSRRLAVVLFAALAVAPSVWADDPTLEVELVPERMGVEDVAQLKITVYDGKVEGEAPRPRRLDNFEIVGGPSVGRQFSLVNGRMSSSVTYTYMVRPRAVGPAGIGPVEVEVDGTTLSSSAIVTEIREGSVQPPRRTRRSPLDPFDRAFGIPSTRRSPKVALRLIAPKDRAVVGEVVPVTVVLDTTAAVDGFEWVEPPSFPGWWSERLETEARVEGEDVEIGGVRYRRYPVARSVLIALEEGRHELPPCSARMGLRTATLFARPQVVERSTKPTVVTVVARPTAPAGYFGATGTLTYRATLEPQRVDLGESAMLTVTLSGTGNLPLAGAPVPWPAPDGVEIYEPEEKLDVEMTAAGPKGACTWSSVILPRRAGTFELGSAPVAVFDAATGRYRTDRLGPFELVVESPPATPTPSPPPESLPPASADEPTSAVAESESPARGTAGFPTWAVVLAAVALGAVLGSAGVLLATRSKPKIPPRRPSESPSVRARELQRVLEAWWREVPESRLDDDMRSAVAELRRELESVRFAPGRADHTETVAELESRLAKLMR